MESLLHYCWKHRLFDVRQLFTVDGRSVEVIDVGLHNSNDGPDFFNSKIKIDGLLYVGNVEIHDKASDWFLHHHELDPKYNNVVLHVCGNVDRKITTQSGYLPPQMQISVPVFVAENYSQLIKEDYYPPCYRAIKNISRLKIHAWMNSLQAERLEEKTEIIVSRLKKSRGDWEKTFFMTIARNFGFGINGDAFEHWASTVDLSAAAHHRDNPFQIEAIFMGQAGLLNEKNIPQRHRQQAIDDDYFQRLKGEYAYLSHKFNLQEMDFSMWRFLRLRPQNFPYIRISQMVNLYCKGRLRLSELCECESVKSVRDLLRTEVTQYWETHYIFGSESKPSRKQLTASSINILIINTAVPMLFAYGRNHGDESLCDRAFDFLEQLKAEDNNIVRMWRDCGLDVKTAGDSQALIQLKKRYCERRDCLRCRIGFEYLSVNQQENKD